jgi:hypothetical protein
MLSKLLNVSIKWKGLDMSKLFLCASVMPPLEGEGESEPQKAGTDAAAIRLFYVIADSPTKAMEGVWNKEGQFPMSIVRELNSADDTHAFRFLRSAL